MSLVLNVAQPSYHIRYLLQESPEGRRMMEFRCSLPAYKEKDAMLRAISQNQVFRV